MTFVRALVLVGSLAGAALLGAGPAGATTTAECRGLLGDLRAATVAAESSFTSARSAQALVAKLDAAALKLDDGNTADAAGKVVDYRDNLTALAQSPKPKVDPAVAEQLLTQSEGVVSCITAIGT